MGSEARLAHPFHLLSDITCTVKLESSGRPVVQRRAWAKSLRARGAPSNHWAASSDHRNSDDLWSYYGNMLPLCPKEDCGQFQPAWRSTATGWSSTGWLRETALWGWLSAGSISTVSPMQDVKKQEDQEELEHWRPHTLSLGYLPADSIKRSEPLLINGSFVFIKQRADWEFVASLVSGSSWQKCKFRWLGLKKVRLVTHKWSKGESRLLSEAVA